MIQNNGTDNLYKTELKVKLLHLKCVIYVHQVLILMFVLLGVFIVLLVRIFHTSVICAT